MCSSVQFEAIPHKTKETTQRKIGLALFFLVPSVFMAQTNILKSSFVHECCKLHCNNYSWVPNTRGAY